MGRKNKLGLEGKKDGALRERSPVVVVLRLAVVYFKCCVFLTSQHIFMNGAMSSVRGWKT